MDGSTENITVIPKTKHHTYRLNFGLLLCRANNKIKIKAFEQKKI